MANKRTAVLCLAVLAGLAAAATAHADDTDILSKNTPAPNVVIILDRSQSMSWYNYTGATRGDEYPGWTGAGSDNTPQARMAMAKSVLSGVVDTFYSRLRFGLASYAERDTGTPPNVNPNAAVRIKRYYYYCTDDGTYCTSASGSRHYGSFTPPTSSLASSGTNTVWNNLQLTTDSSNINMPSQNTFTVNWALNTSVSPNPSRTGPFSSTSGAVSAHPNQWRCDWDLDDYEYNPDGTVKSGYNPRTTVNAYQGAWVTTGAAAACPAGVTESTVTQTETFDQKVAGDDPNPYKYNITRSWSGTAIFSAGCSSPCVDAAQYNAQQPQASWNDYRRRLYNPRVEFSPAVAASPGTTVYYYTYTWSYKGNCAFTGAPSPNGCSGYLTTSRSVNTATQPATTPIPPAPAAPLTVPFTRLYTWSGNTYELNPPETLATNSCGVGSGVTVLVDVGGGDQTALHNYLGTGPDKTKELHAANYYTPLAQGLTTTLQYFLNLTGPVQSDPQKDCRKNFVILVTDGGESCPLVPTTGAGSPGSYAAALLAARINALGGAKTYVVAVDGGALGTDEKTVLADIANRGGTARVCGIGATCTAYYSASNSAALTAALNVIIGSILSQTYNFVSPVVPTMRTSDNLMLIQGGFTTPAAPPADVNAPLWQGVLTAYPLNSNGTITESQQTIAATPLWEAGAKLATTAAANRTVWTVLNGTLADFRPPNNTLQTAMNMTLDLDGNGQVNAADAVVAINLVRGASPGSNGYLGDIFHSTPIIVGPPSLTYADRTFDPANPTQLLSLTSAPDTFATFRTAHSTRQRIVLVGANDGMLHAFNAGTYDSVSAAYNTGDGKEVWGFIPPQLLPNLQYLAVNQGHRYFVDGSPRVADVWLDGVSNDGSTATTDGVKAANEWHTVLVGGFRQGGTGLYALDVTDTTNPKFLWTFATTGQSWSEPAFGKVKVQVSGRLVDRWVVFVGDGYDPGGTNGKKVHAIDIQTGKALWQYATTASVAAGPIALDLNSDGYVDRVYVGTVGGDLLRLDVSAVGKSSTGGSVDPASNVMVATCPTTSPNCWSGSVFFSAGASQPFYTKMAATTDPEGNLWLFAGSGDRSNPLLVPGTPYRSYGIKDAYSGTAIPAVTEASLTDMTGINTLDPSSVSGAGWFFTFRSGEKEWAEVALVFNSQVFFTTFTPGTTGCGDVGSGTVYMVYYLTGGGVTDTALFQADPPQASSRIYEVNAGATARPVVTTGLQGTNAVVYFGTSHGLTITPKFSTPSSIRSTRYWRRLLP